MLEHIDRWSKFKPRDIMVFVKTGSEKSFETKVTGITKYERKTALEEYLKTETLKRALPKVRTLEEGIQICLSFGTTLEEIATYGFLGIQMG